MDRDPALSPRHIAISLALVAGLTTLLMVVQLTILQQLDGGVPGVRGLIAIVLLYGGVAASGWRRREPQARRPVDRWLLGAVVMYFTALVACMAVFRPETHQSTGVHQTVGECYVEARDITGMTRFEYLCVSDFDEDFSFSCVDEPPQGSRWYTVCGRPHRDFPRWMGVMLALGLLGSLVYAGLLRWLAISSRRA
jgi:hypothetical protein